MVELQLSEAIVQGWDGDEGISHTGWEEATRPFCVMTTNHTPNLHAQSAHAVNKLDENGVNICEGAASFVIELKLFLVISTISYAEDEAIYEAADLFDLINWGQGTARDNIKQDKVLSEWVSVRRR